MKLMQVHLQNLISKKRNFLLPQAWRNAADIPILASPANSTIARFKRDSRLH
jgi:hypothetical protein